MFVSHLHIIKRCEKLQMYTFRGKMYFMTGALKLLLLEIAPILIRPWHLKGAKYFLYIKMCIHMVQFCTFISLFANPGSYPLDNYPPDNYHPDKYPRIITP